MSEMAIMHEKDADLSVLNGRTVAVIGYGSQGKAQAMCLRDSGVKVILGLRPTGKSFAEAQRDGFQVFPIAEAAKQADIMILYETKPFRRRCE